MKNYKRIGMVGGISPQSSVLFYRELIKKHFREHNNHYYPEIVMFSVDFGRLKDFQEDSDPKEYIKEIINAIDSLERAGADFAVIASNTPHRVFHQVEKRVSIPMLSMIDVIADYALNANYKKVLLLGTRYTMTEDFYKKGLLSKGIQAIVPSDNDQTIINNVIFDELVEGKVIQTSKIKLIEIIKTNKVDAVVLGCTELPLIVSGTDVDTPLIDTTTVFAGATLNYALL